MSDNTTSNQTPSAPERDDAGISASAARIEVLVEQYVAMFGMSRMEAY
ncbi:hypothetical protein CF328_g7402, partial [Tilletia controversa]